MLRKLATSLIKLKIKHAPHLSNDKFDKYGFSYLGLYKPNLLDDYCYTHTRAVFYTKTKENNFNTLLISSP